MSNMPAAHPEKFREDVVAVARRGEAPVADIAPDFDISVVLARLVEDSGR